MDDWLQHHAPDLPIERWYHQSRKPGESLQIITGWTLTSWMTGVNASRNMREGYTLAPINDPRKLELMRCAYQRAISPCTCRGESDFCPNCEKRFNRFYLGTETPGKTPKQTYDGNLIYGYEDGSGSVREVFVDLNEFGTLVAKDAATGQPEFWDPATILTYKQSNTAPKLFPLYVDNSVAEFTSRSGRVTAACLHGQCWFQCGKWSDYKKHRSRCTLAGHYCDTYVWVPDTGTDQLTKLTLTILDVAYYEPAVILTPTKVVTIS